MRHLVFYMPRDSNHNSLLKLFEDSRMDKTRGLEVFGSDSCQRFANVATRETFSIFWLESFVHAKT